MPCEPRSAETNPLACELDARDLQLDWRRNDAAHESFRAASHSTVESQALEITKHLGLGYSSQDWVVAGDGTYFLDLIRRASGYSCPSRWPLQLLTRSRHR